MRSDQRFVPRGLVSTAKYMLSDESQRVWVWNGLSLGEWADLHCLTLGSKHSLTGWEHSGFAQPANPFSSAVSPGL